MKYYNEHHEGRGGNAEIYFVHTVVGYVVHTAGLSFMSKDFTVHPGGLGDNEKNYAVHALPFRSTSLKLWLRLSLCKWWGCQA